MTSQANPGILKAALDESNRLKTRLRANSDFQQLEAVQRLIELYPEGEEFSDRGNPIVGSDRPKRPITAKNPSSAIQLPKRKPRINSQSEPVASLGLEPQTKSYRRGWKKGDSQAARIRAAALAYLRKTGRRTKGPEISRAILAAGVEVRGKKPASVVSNALRYSADFNWTEGGFGLSEWAHHNLA